MKQWRFFDRGSRVVVLGLALGVAMSGGRGWGATAHAAETAGYQYQLVENWAQLPAGTKWTMMTAVDLDAQGTLYVLQRGEPAKVMVFDPAGKLLRTWGEGMFPSAHGLRVDAAGNVWVTDRKLQQVIKFSPEGKRLLELGKKGVAGENDSTEALNGPSDVVVAPGGEIFVSDGESRNTRVVKFAADGKFIKYWGTKGAGPGQLDVPHAIVMDSKGRLYVANRSNARVEIFDQEGGYLGVLNNVGTPYGLFMTKDDVLYATDGTEGKDDLTVVDTRSGKVLAHFGGLVGPHMLAVDAHGAIYVAETRGNAVKKFVRK
jgi:DNA-binding beta-propeller fold protein YncE